MLKLAGCACILFASFGMACSYISSLCLGLRQMMQLLELLTVIESEITYSRCPLPELLPRLSKHLPQPYQNLLVQCARNMEDNREADILTLWKTVCAEYKDSLAFPTEAYRILLRTGEVFSYASLESSLRLLKISQKQLELLIEKGQEGYEGKKKLYCCLCFMTGFSSIIILL